MSVRTWVIAQRLVFLSIVVVSALLGPFGSRLAVDPIVAVLAISTIVAIASLTLLHPDRSWWADEVRAHAHDPAALRADRKGHLVALAVTLAIALLLPAILTITGLYRLL